MALIKCSECGGEISDQAKACPHCGKSLTRSVLSAIGVFLASWFLIQCVIGLAVLFLSLSVPSQYAEQEAFLAGIYPLPSLVGGIFAIVACIRVSYLWKSDLDASSFEAIRVATKLGLYVAVMGILAVMLGICALAQTQGPLCHGSLGDNWWVFFFISVFSHGWLGVASVLIAGGLCLDAVRDVFRSKSFREVS